MDFSKLLSATASASRKESRRNSCRVDNEERRYAEEQLAIFAHDQFPQYVLALMEQLVDTSKPTAIRQRAGILFKTSISGLVFVLRFAHPSRAKTV